MTVKPLCKRYLRLVTLNCCHNLDYNTSLLRLFVLGVKEVYACLVVVSIDSFCKGDDRCPKPHSAKNYRFILPSITLKLVDFVYLFIYYSELATIPFDFLYVLFWVLPIIIELAMITGAQVKRQF